MNFVPARGELGRERLPCRQVEDHAEVTDGDVLAVDEAGGLGHSARADLVRDDLVAVEIEVDPFVRRAPFGAAEEIAVEAPRLPEIGHGKREVEARVVRSRQVRGHQLCIPQRRTVRASTVRNMTFSTTSPIRITVNSPANTAGISSWFLFS